MILRGHFIYLIYTFALVIQLNVNAQDKTDNSTEMTSELIQPLYLKAGDTIAIVAPSGILKNREREVQQAVELLKSWGLHAIVGKHVFSKADHFAGADDERCEDFQKRSTSGLRFAHVQQCRFDLLVL